MSFLKALALHVRRVASPVLQQLRAPRVNHRCTFRKRMTLAHRVQATDTVSWHRNAWHALPHVDSAIRHLLILANVQLATQAVSLHISKDKPAPTARRLVSSPMDSNAALVTPTVQLVRRHLRTVSLVHWDLQS